MSISTTNYRWKLAQWKLSQWIVQPLNCPANYMLPSELFVLVNILYTSEAGEE